MNIDHFARLVNLEDQTELEKVALLAYYFEVDKDQPEFPPSEVADSLVALGHARPNVTRMTGHVRGSRDFIRGSKSHLFRLSKSKKSKLAVELPHVSDSEEIISDSSVLPEILFDGLGRLYLEKTVQQINACYESNLYDAASLMMRRLLELLLVHSFQAASIETEILDPDGGYAPLKSLINKAKSKQEIGLSPSVRRVIDQFRELGNLSAHHIHYTCRRDDIRTIRMDYRATIEELLYKAGFMSR